MIIGPVVLVLYHAEDLVLVFTGTRIPEVPLISVHSKTMSRTYSETFWIFSLQK